MRFPRDPPDAETVATVDIETTATNPQDGELVSVGVGVHERAAPLTDATYETFHRDGDGEVSLIRRAMDRLDRSDADALVTYNGIEFDLPFVEGRLARHGASLDLPAITAAETHVDLFPDRRDRAEERDEPWPSLEACLESYGYAPAKTVWRGDPVTNGVFGDELGPAYLRTLGTETGDRFRETLAAVIDHYLRTDLEANLALFYADVGEPFESAYLGTESRFDG
ncbi:ribonuclease H-like domain-containing protein [Haloplanus halophilus]|uniref:ribonuclease H-like domain-containing protein n=1 Tax=Haloplanus halophilus TaxID=2949993 RepID=UPI00203C545C|nr:ribonuclease H-like domain-containing protein [Haloplanus sp. GDY1]